MTEIPVRCLRCGEHHRLVRASHGRLDQGECPRCGYVGWTPVRNRPPQAAPPAHERLRAVT